LIGFLWLMQGTGLLLLATGSTLMELAVCWRWRSSVVGGGDAGAGGTVHGMTSSPAVQPAYLPY
jgi:hypothetical protein